MDLPGNVRSGTVFNGRTPRVGSDTAGANDL